MFQRHPGWRGGHAAPVDRGAYVHQDDRAGGARHQAGPHPRHPVRPAGEGPRRPPARHRSRGRPEPHLRPGRATGAALGRRHRRADRARRRRRRGHPERLRAAPPVLRRRPGGPDPGAGQRPDAQGRGGPRRLRQRRHARAADGRIGRQRRLERRRPQGRARRRGRALLHVGHHRQAQGSGPHPQGAGRSGGQRGAVARTPAPRRGGDRAARRPHHGVRRADRPRASPASRASCCRSSTR